MMHFKRPKNRELQGEMCGDARRRGEMRGDAGETRGRCAEMRGVGGRGWPTELKLVRVLGFLYQFDTPATSLAEVRRI